MTLNTVEALNRSLAWYNWHTCTISSVHLGVCITNITLITARTDKLYRSATHSYSSVTIPFCQFCYISAICELLFQLCCCQNWNGFSSMSAQLSFPFTNIAVWLEHVEVAQQPCAHGIFSVVQISHLKTTNIVVSKSHVLVITKTTAFE